MRPMAALSMLACAATAALFACSTKSDADDGQRDAATAPPLVRSDGGDEDEDPVEVKVPDAAPDAALPRAGDYFASCVTELGAGDPKTAFSFWATAETANGAFTITLEALRIVAERPPTTVSRAGITGGKLLPIGGTLESDGGFNASMGVLEKATFPADANPLSGGDVVIARLALAGVYKPQGFCARLAGTVEQPTAAARDLDPARNFCVFAPIADGAPAPAFAASNYTVEQCPL